jgi:DNA-binding beta-propeller fold protein YncE
MGMKLWTSSACVAVLVAVALAQTSCAPTANPAAQRPAVTPSGATPALLLVDVDGTGSTLRVRPVDPISLQEAPAVQPIPLGRNYTSALSPDGRTFAAITWPNERTANRGGVLHVIDLVGWTDRKTTVTFDDHVRQLLFAPDGRQLYWVRPSQMTGEPAQNPDPGVYRYDLASDRVSRVAALPPMFFPEFAGVGVAGDRMAIVGSRVGDASPSRGAEVYVVDLAKGSLRAKFELAGIRAGQVRDTEAAADDVRNVRPAIGWDLPRGRLYVIDADDDRVAVIDLASAAMRGPFDIRPRASLLGRLLGLISSPADAKAQSSSDRRAVVSPDGRRLYLSGFRSDFVGSAGPQDSGREQVTPLPLQVIDVTDMTEIGRIDVASTEFAISPDGRRLLAVTNRFDPSPAGWATRTNYELRLIDTERLTQIGSIAIEDRGRIIGLASDTAYVAAHVGSESTVVRRVALADLRMEQVRKIDGGVAELFFPDEGR